MTGENQVYFPITGDETHGFVCVRLYSEAGVLRAEASVEGPMTESADYRDVPSAGDPHEVLRDVRDVAGVRGLDIRIKLDRVDWDPELGSLVE